MLRNALTSNAVFSLGSGIVMLLGTSWLGQHIPLPTWAWAILGTGLILFALQLGAMVLKPGLARLLTRQVVAADVAWVALTSLGAIVFFTRLSATGVILVLAVNLVVALLAVFQQRGFQQESLSKVTGSIQGHPA